MRPVSGALLLLLLSFAGLSGCGKFFYFPDHNLHFPPEENGYHPQDVRFESLDKTPLFAWFFPSQKKSAPKATIFQCHGNAENISSHYANLVWLTKANFNLFTFDYRGYGKSKGEPNAEGVLLDAKAALKKAFELHEHSRAKKFIVVGQSLGGIICARAVAEWEQEKIDYLVLDSTFSSFKDLVQEKMASIWTTWLFSPMGRWSVSDEFASKSVLGKIRIPTLVIHDRKDPVVDFDNGSKIYDSLTQAKERLFWTIDEGTHVGFLGKPDRREQFRNLLLKL